MTESITVPLSKLRPSSLNMRSIGVLEGIDEMMASIQAHGIINPLSCWQKSKNVYEVVAGGRRFQALLQLVNAKLIPADYPVPITVWPKEMALELSLAENEIRLPPHAYDQMRAFNKLVAGGMSAADVAARFGVTEKLVVQRLALAQLDDRILALFCENKVTLSEMKALTATKDHERQYRVLMACSTYGDRSYSISRMLKKETIPLNYALFDVAEYRQRGGTVLQDLFDASTGDGYAEDATLFEELQTAALEQRIEMLKDTGWAEVIHVPTDQSLYYWVRQQKLEAMEPAGRSLPPAEAQEHAEASARLLQLQTWEDEDTWTEEMQNELERLGDRLDVLEERETPVWSAEQKAQGIVLVQRDAGPILFHYGYKRIEEPAGSPVSGENGAEGTDGAPAPVAPTVEAPTEELEDPGKPYIQAVTEDLSHEKGKMLQDLISTSPEWALRLTVGHLILGKTWVGQHVGAMTAGMSREIHPTAGKNPALKEGLETLLRRIGIEPGWQSYPSTGMADRQPALWQAIAEAPFPLVQTLHAYLVAQTVGVQLLKPGEDPIYYRYLAEAFRLKMRDRWRPSRDFFKRITRGHMLAILEKDCPSLHENWKKLKHGELVERMTKLFDEAEAGGWGWLPQRQQRALEKIRHTWVPSWLDYWDVDGADVPPAVKEAAE